MDKYYIDLSVQNSSELLKNNYPMIPIQYNNNNSNFNNNGDIIEGFGNFGRVNLEKCCPLEYMWSEGQKKCVKVCDGCAIGAYGDINYEFLTSNGEFMSFAQCVGDATGAYDFDKINRRYGADELLTQHDLNHHIDSDPSASGVQPSEENPWDSVTGGMYQVSSKQQQMNIRQTGRWSGDDDTWNTYLDCNASGECSSASGVFTRMTDVQRYDLQDGVITREDIEDEQVRTERLQGYRNTICSSSNIILPYIVTTNPDAGTDNTNSDIQYRLCNDEGQIDEGWTSLCGLDDFNNLNFGGICDYGDITSLCGINDDGSPPDKLNKILICPDNR